MRDAQSNPAATDLPQQHAPPPTQPQRQMAVTPQPGPTKQSTPPTSLQETGGSDDKPGVGARTGAGRQRRTQPWEKKHRAQKRPTPHSSTTAAAAQGLHEELSGRTNPDGTQAHSEIHSESQARGSEPGTSDLLTTNGDQLSASEEARRQKLARARALANEPDSAPDDGFNSDEAGEREGEKIDTLAPLPHERGSVRKSTGTGRGKCKGEGEGGRGARLDPLAEMRRLMAASDSDDDDADEPQPEEEAEEDDGGMRGMGGTRAGAKAGATALVVSLPRSPFSFSVPLSRSLPTHEATVVVVYVF
eukprot:COSAG05_NODE_2165_length_3447_cov_8.954002_3_plen_304_part_00